MSWSSQNAGFSASATSRAPQRSSATKSRAAPYPNHREDRAPGLTKPDLRVEWPPVRQVGEFVERMGQRNKLAHAGCFGVFFVEYFFAKLVNQLTGPLAQ